MFRYGTSRSYPDVQVDLPNPLGEHFLTTADTTYHIITQQQHWPRTVLGASPLQFISSTDGSALVPIPRRRPGGRAGRGRRRRRRRGRLLRRRRRRDDDRDDDRDELGCGASSSPAPVTRPSSAARDVHVVVVSCRSAIVGPPRGVVVAVKPVGLSRVRVVGAVQGVHDGRSHHDAGGVTVRVGGRGLPGGSAALVSASRRRRVPTGGLSGSPTEPPPPSLSSVHPTTRSWCRVEDEAKSAVLHHKSSSGGGGASGGGADAGNGTGTGTTGVYRGESISKSGTETWTYGTRATVGTTRSTRSESEGDLLEEEGGDQQSVSVGAVGTCDIVDDYGGRWEHPGSRRARWRRDAHAGGGGDDKFGGDGSGSFGIVGGKKGHRRRGNNNDNSAGNSEDGIDINGDGGADDANTVKARTQQGNRGHVRRKTTGGSVGGLAAMFGGSVASAAASPAQRAQIRRQRLRRD